MHILEDKLEEILHYYFVDKYTPAKIGKIFNVSRHNVVNLFEMHKIPMRNLSESHFEPINEKIIVDMYVNKKISSYDIANEMGVSSKKIVTTLRRNKIEIRGPKIQDKKRKIKDEEFAKIKMLYEQERKSTLDIAAIYNVSFNTIYNFMERHNLPRRSISEANTLIVDEKKIIKLYKSGLSPVAIGKFFNVSSWKIIDVLKKMNVKIRSKSETVKTEIWQKNNRKFFISKKELEKLYLKNKLSSIEIGEIYKVSCRSVLSLLKYYNIKIRDSKQMLKDPDFRAKIEAKNLKKFGEKKYANTEDFRTKRKKTFLKNYGVENPFLLPEIQQKANLTKSKNNSLPCSKQQKYLCEIYNGKINYLIEPYLADMVLKNNIICEYDGSGHKIKIRDKMETEESFNTKEKRRQSYLITKGYKIFRIISRKDYLPSEKKILSILKKAKIYFKNGCKLIFFDIDKGKIIVNNKEINYNFGEIAKI